ncbi:asparagine synthase (glutamine-hydrolyzing) [Candidatus Nitronereus thalassa]|uniref:asparagine synthase (glutamine-hydrolyzing) n=1 Tax=Candidatus Nitronereus thalassa TaxID=3020898 RepID=A0ABU3K5D9_9BACT|nr:asparagine synthase (glutamine-hydrolyzing) [Candidatus Nitronereus thalassa]MDT7041558.1 asparagine synthase (glutamine-hydrolyzing) [Candidatus Nitronereus thalassa]
MCGFCGIASDDNTSIVSQNVLEAMRDSFEHRGPDDHGVYIQPGIALGSRRLSIQDLSERGHMPMGTRDGRYWIAYNGEVYNANDLRHRLKSRGYEFFSNTDTEVVLNLFAEYGPDMLEQLNGMFAVAIWDQKERKLFLARDRVGIKPLFYSYYQGALYFASEAKGLFASGVPSRFDESSWEELLCFRYVAGERTPFEGVFRLLPGHFMTWQDGKSQIHRWWNLTDRAQALRENLPRNPLEWFQETFEDSVNVRRIGDVPIGVLLSGGLDSNSVAASLSAQAGSGVASFTVRFEEPEYDEGPLARQVADKLNLDHHELFLSPQELLPLLFNGSRLNDEPLVHGNDLHLWRISQMAKDRVTVLLSGEGSDELLGGYVRYQPLRSPWLLNAARPVLPYFVSKLGLNGRLLKLSRFLQLGSIDNFILFNSCDVFPDDLKLLGMKTTGRYPFRERVLAESKSLYRDDPMRQAMFSDQHTFLCSILDRNDRMTMGASIECRVPFLDYRLVEGLAALPSSTLLQGKESKYLLRETLGRRLPLDIQKHRKWGFGVPWASYFRQIPEWRRFVQDLPNMSPINGGPFERSQVKRIVEQFLEGEKSVEPLVKQLVMVTGWYKAFFEHASIPESLISAH